MEAEKSSRPEESKDYSILFNKLFGAILINILFKPLPIFTNRIPIEFDLNFSSTLFWSDKSKLVFTTFLAFEENHKVITIINPEIRRYIGFVFTFSDNISIEYS